MLDMEDKHGVQLQSMKEEKDRLQVLVSKQSSVIEELERQLVTAAVNSSALQEQQRDLMETVHSLLTMMSAPGCECSPHRPHSGSALQSHTQVLIPQKTHSFSHICDLNALEGLNTEPIKKEKVEGRRDIFIQINYCEAKHPDHTFDLWASKSLS